MNASRLSLEALPFDRVSRHPDIVLAALVALVVAMMIVPLPTRAIDALLALNVALSALVLVSVLLARRTLSLSTFPSLLLITTLFRLSLNVSTTRSILARGDGGEVVRAFGEFVLSGDLIVGLVVFSVIALVQFIVIAKGSERVAEVGARFTLDAMPGKQMSIDAAARSGSITEEEAQERRSELSRESQFYGAMDGAMKFIKGDAIAGLIITGINLVAGMIIGVVRFHESLGEAASHYSVLSVGDGLVSQIPALLITLAAGIMTTRVAAKESDASLGASLKAELFDNPRVLGIGAAFAGLLAILPGLPTLPFGSIALVLAMAAILRRARVLAISAKAADETRQERAIERKVQQAKAQRAIVDRLAPTVAGISVDLDPSLSEALGLRNAEEGHASDLVDELMPQLREALYVETGVLFPGVRIRTEAKLPKNSFTIRLRDVPVVQESLSCELHMAIESVQRIARLGIQGVPARHPISGIEVVMIPASHVAAATGLGIQVWSPAGILALHVACVLKRQAKDFIGLQETADLVERLEKVCPTLVKEVVPKIVTLAQLTEILKRLVDEGVSIRDLKTILEALSQFGTHQTDSVLLTEHVRGALSLQISHAHAGSSGKLSVVLLDPVIEDTIQNAIMQAAGGSYLALDPDIREAILQEMMRVLGPVIRRGIKPIILTNAEVRRYVRKLMELDFPDAAILSFQELPAGLTIHPLGRVAMRDRALSPAA
jgi:type III secretion protein V